MAPLRICPALAAVLVCAPLALALPLPAITPKSLNRLAFGSCNHQWDPAYHWDDIANVKPDAFLWLGDIAYLDIPKIIWKWRMHASVDSLQRGYREVKAEPHYARFAATVPVGGVFDDHDAGVNDADRTISRELVAAAHQSLFEFLDEPAGSERRARAAAAPDGVGGAYSAHFFGAAPRRVRLIVLDVRSFRDPWPEDRARGDPLRSQDVLGQAQWDWLERLLTTTTADVTIIASGLQAIGRNDPYVAEVWGKLPESQAKLFSLLAATNTTATVLLSGDVHVAEVNRLSCAALGYPLWEVTSSGLTHAWGGESLVGRATAAVWRAIVMGHTRVPGQLFQRPHYALLDIDWAEAEGDADPATGECAPGSVPLRDAHPDAVAGMRARLEAEAAAHPERRGGVLMLPQCIRNDAEHTHLDFSVRGTRPPHRGEVVLRQRIRLASLRPAGGAGLAALERVRCPGAAAGRLEPPAPRPGGNYSVLSGPEHAPEFVAAAEDYSCRPRMLDAPDDTGYPLLTSGVAVDTSPGAELDLELLAAVRQCASSRLDQGFSAACRRVMHSCSPKLRLQHSAAYYVNHALIAGVLCAVVAAGLFFAGWAMCSKRAARLPGGRPVWSAVGVAALAGEFGLLRLVL